MATALARVGDIAIAAAAITAVTTAAIQSDKVRRGAPRICNVIVVSNSCGGCCLTDSPDGGILFAKGIDLRLIRKPSLELANRSRQCIKMPNGPNGAD
ncbi:hypothetical protein ACFWWT_03405 [Streptomyces sp. NPDC058676]|uniref:hypothetical protein n=1 Tax=unclassified Streptomyces TaxID=2593676 RepID=UPI00366A2595